MERFTNPSSHLCTGKLCGPQLLRFVAPLQPSNCAQGAMAHTLYSHGQRGAELSLTVGTCPVRGSNTAIKCGDQNCKAYIDQVPPSADLLPRARPAYACSAGARRRVLHDGLTHARLSGRGAGPPAVLCRRHQVLQRLWPVAVLVRIVSRSLLCLRR